MYKTSINTESFELEFYAKWFKKGEVLESKENKLTTIWYKIKYYLGCTPLYHCIVQDEPKQKGNNFVYNVKYSSKTIRIFGIKIITIKHE